MRTFAVRMLASRIAPMLLIVPFRTSVWIGVQSDVGCLTEMHARKIVLVNITDHPHIGQIRDRERIRRGKPLYTRRHW